MSLNARGIFKSMCNIQVFPREKSKMKRQATRISIVAAVMAAVFVGGVWAADPPKAGLPMITSSAGQSTGVIIVNALCDRAGIKYDYCDTPTPAQFAAGVGMGDFKEGSGAHLELKSGAPKGTQYKSLVIALGASLKGMGAAGLSVETEIARVRQIVEYCKKNKIFVVAVHVEGKARRGKPGSDNELLIDAIVPQSDYVIVTADGNFDNRFDAITKKSGAPLSVIKNTSELTGILEKMFK